MSINIKVCRFAFKAFLSWAVLASSAGVRTAHAEDEFFVPGTGSQIPQIGDDFEDPNWGYNQNAPKASEEDDGQTRLPAGRSANGRWAECLKRGNPDYIKRVKPPAGGIAGSEGAMLMMSLYTGVPGQFSGKTHQDDLIALVDMRLGGPIPVSNSPSVVTHVYIPKWDKWERREGNSFAFRAAVQTHKVEMKVGRFFGFGGGYTTKLDTYWPGMLIGFKPGDGKDKPDSAVLRVRANRGGGDFEAVQITKPGWWTLGMSFTPDGQVHYFAHEGVEALSAKDHIASEYPYGMACEQFETFFFDVLNGDNGNWSTPWVVDDSFVYWNRK